MNRRGFFVIWAGAVAARFGVAETASKRRRPSLTINKFTPQMERLIGEELRRFDSQLRKGFGRFQP